MGKRKHSALQSLGSWEEIVKDEEEPPKPTGAKASAAQASKGLGCKCSLCDRTPEVRCLKQACCRAHA